MGLDAVAVEFHLVHPAVAAGTVLARIGLQGGMKRNLDTGAACVSVWISDSGSNARAVIHCHRLKSASFQSCNVHAVLGGDGQHGFR